MISEDLLSILRCPVTHQPLHAADSSLLARLNAKIEAGQVVNRLGEAISQPLDGGLVNQAGTLLYAVRDDIPCLLTDEAIDLEQYAD